MAVEGHWNENCEYLVVSCTVKSMTQDKKACGFEILYQESKNKKKEGIAPSDAVCDFVVIYSDPPDL